MGDVVTDTGRKLQPSEFNEDNHSLLIDPDSDDDDDYDDDVLLAKVSPTLQPMAFSKQQQHHNSRTQGRDDRATLEQVLDPRTRMILFKLLSRGFLASMDGCLCTGKEANVYYAKGACEQEYALKVYKTSILVFKDRDKYVAGESRWQNGYCKSNPRKMVKLWAEKEMRNYRRIHAAGIPCPTPVLLKAHVLVMQFLGRNGWPSPRLKDANLNESRLREAYVQAVLIMRHMYQRCKLVHGDFSEYNLLWHDSQLYVIDVSQSVESHHPAALDFLRSDIANINDFFRKATTFNTMTTRQLFDFVTTDCENQMDVLDQIMWQVQETAERLAGTTEQQRREYEQQEALNEAVFMNSFLPRSLNQVAEYEIRQIEKGNVDETFALAVATLTVDANAGAVAANDDGYRETSANDGEPNVHSEMDSSEHDSSASSNDCDSEGPFVKVPKTAEQLEAEKVATRTERKQNKKDVKEAKSERRLTKIKKKDKKRAIKKAKAGNRKNK